MSAMPLRLTLPTLLLALTGCTAVEVRTAIKIQLTADDVDMMLASLDAVHLVIDPLEPYTDADGSPLTGELADDAWLEDVLTEDADLELVRLVDLDGAGRLPIIELRPGAHTGGFSVVAHGYLGTTWTAESDVLGTLEYTIDEVPTLELSLALLATPITQCMNGLDDDADGWADGDDPDCAEGDEEGGFGENACNDGEDNDGDGAIDVEDAECDSATDEDEWDPCLNSLDDDGDGWIDADDPDCDKLGDELGLGTTECNDGLDNDGNGDIDSEDDDILEVRAETTTLKALYVPITAEQPAEHHGELSTVIQEARFKQMTGEEKDDGMGVAVAAAAVFLVIAYSMS